MSENKFKVRCKNLNLHFKLKNHNILLGEIKDLKNKALYHGHGLEDSISSRCQLPN